MNMVIFNISLILVIINGILGLMPYEDYTVLYPVNEKDSHWGIVQAEIERITKSDPNSPIGYKIEKFGVINTKDANSLFAGWKFYGFDYVDYTKNPSDKNKFHLVGGLGLRTTLAVFSDSNL